MYFFSKFIDNDIPDVYLITLPNPLNLKILKLQVEEVSDAKLVTLPQLYSLVKSEAFSPLINSNELIENSSYFKLFQVLSERFPGRE